MPTVQSRHPIVVLASVFGSFAAAPFLGIAVASWVAPGSGLAQFVSPLAFVMVHVGGLAMWFGFSVVSVIGNGLVRLLRGEWSSRSLHSSELPNGYGAFLWLGAGFGLVAGAVVGLAPQSSSFGLSCAAHLAAGTAYGASLRALARYGFLPVPDPS